MSYTIIFQTKIIKLDDGRIIHLSRQGCNNDTEGRQLTVFDGKLYTIQEFEEKIKEYETQYPESELKIGDRWSNRRGYAEHLRRMLKRAVTWQQLKERASSLFAHAPHIEYPYHGAVRLNGENEYKPYDLTNPEENEAFFKLYDNFRAGHSYRLTYDNEYDIDKIVKMLEKDNYAEFHVA